MNTQISRRKLFKLGAAGGVGPGLSAWLPWMRAAAQEGGDGRVSVGHAPFVDVAAAPGGGFWALNRAGRVFSYGGAPKFAAPPEPVKELYVSLAATPTG